MPLDVQDFQTEVLDQSHKIPVLVDFWAPWCGPCKVLGPVLEQLAKKHKERWILAKVNTEEFPDLASHYRVASIPNVKLFVDGKIVQEFQGAMPEERMEQWLQKFLPSRFQKQLEKAQSMLHLNQAESARQLLQKILQEEPENPQAKVMMAQITVFADTELALRYIQDIPEPGLFDKVESIHTLARLFGLLQNPEALPENPVKQPYLAAIRETQSGNFDAAIEKFIEVLSENRSYDEEGPRKACIALFKFLGEEHEITKKRRRQFNSALYV